MIYDYRPAVAAVCALAARLSIDTTHGTCYHTPTGDYGADDIGNPPSSDDAVIISDEGVPFSEGVSNGRL